MNERLIKFNSYLRKKKFYSNKQVDEKSFRKYETLNCL